MRAVITSAILLALTCGCSSLLRQDESSIHEQLLQKLPVGSTYQQVFAYAKRKGWQPTDGRPAGVYYYGSGTPTKWITCHLGSYKPHYRRAIPDRIDVSAYWCFDEGGRMLDVIVFRVHMPLEGELNPPASVDERIAFLPDAGPCSPAATEQVR